MATKLDGIYKQYTEDQCILKCEESLMKIATTCNGGSKILGRDQKWFIIRNELVDGFVAAGVDKLHALKNFHIDATQLIYRAESEPIKDKLTEKALKLLENKELNVTGKLEEYRDDLLQKDTHEKLVRRVGSIFKSQGRNVSDRMTSKTKNAADLYVYSEGKKLGKIIEIKQKGDAHSMAIATGELIWCADIDPTATWHVLTPAQYKPEYSINEKLKACKIQWMGLNNSKFVSY